MTFLGWFLLALFTVEFWWLIAAVLCIVLAVRLARRWLATDAARTRARVRRNAELALRADKQNRQVAAGDPRGIYGRFWDGPNEFLTPAGPSITAHTGSAGGP